jgi:NAD+ diphosphatase
LTLFIRGRYAKRPSDAAFRALFLIIVPARSDLGPQPRLGYSASLIDRAAGLRGDDVALKRFFEDARAGVYVVGGELVVLKTAGEACDPLFSLGEARGLGAVRETVLLGLLDGAPRFGFGLDPETAERLKSRNDLKITDLRSIAVQGMVGADHLPPLAEAKALLGWHARHCFCPNCASPTNVVDAGWRRDCPSCRAQHFPRTDPVVIMLVILGERCVLGRSRRFAPSMWSCLAGFAEPGETIEEAVRREVLEEAGIACGRVKYFASQPWPFPSSIMIGCHAEALSDAIVVDREELEDARWFDRDELALMLKRQHPQGLTTPPPVAIAHHIIRDYVENGRDVFR